MSLDENWHSQALAGIGVNGRFTVRIEGEFESSHALRAYLPGGEDEPVHGHTWKVEIFITTQAGTLDEHGLLFDFLACQAELNEACSNLTHRHINDLSDFTEVNPTTENICLWFYARLDPVAREKGGALRRIRVWEGPHNIAELELNHAN